MAILTVNGSIQPTQYNWCGLINALLADCPLTGASHTLLKEWAALNLLAEGYTSQAIEEVKAFDDYLSSDRRSPLLLSLGFPPAAGRCDPFLLRYMRQLLRIGWKTTHGRHENESDFALAACRRLAYSGRHDQKSEYFHRARRIIHDLFRGVPVPSIDSLKLAFGPGSTAESHRFLDEKTGDLQWSSRWLKYARPSDLSFNDDSLNDLRVLERPITTLVAVPKDSRGPRIISKEPNTLMLFQQGIWKNLEQLLRLRAPEIRFRDQLSHRTLLYDRENSSIDLSDASDYVSRRLVWQLFPQEWREFLFAFRSAFIDSAGVRYPLRAFAPMGSALCFPIEAIVHWAAVKAAQLDLPKEYRKEFSVYGDDIIVHSVVAGSVLTALRSLGLNPNDRKCFINRAFRESCGLDLFLSEERQFDVTPAYVRSPLSGHSNIQALLQLALVQNHLYEYGHKESADFLHRYIMRYCPGLPRTAMRLIGGFSILTETGHSRARFNRNYQRSEIRTLLLEPKEQRVQISDDQLLFTTVGLGYKHYSCHTGVNRPVWSWVSYTP